MTDLLIQGVLDTLYMTTLATVLAYVAGIPLGVILVLTAKGGAEENRLFHRLLEAVINIWRSIPFFILMIALIPVTRVLAGKSIGVNAAAISLFIGAIPFTARLVEQTLLEVDSGLIDACQVMGCTTMQIIMVLIRESIPSLIRGLALTYITLIGYSAMAGVVGGGGLGVIAINYGFHRYEYGVMMTTLVIIVAIVMIAQFLFHCLAKRVDKRLR